MLSVDPADISHVSCTAIFFFFFFFEMYEVLGLLLYSLVSVSFPLKAAFIGKDQNLEE